jgi:hypothetical protein
VAPGRVEVGEHRANRLFLEAIAAQCVERRADRLFDGTHTELPRELMSLLRRTLGQTFLGQQQAQNAVGAKARNAQRGDD